MALREFRDSQGRAWMAWDVPPPRTYSYTRSGADRRVTPTPGYKPERRMIVERRRRTLMAGLERGWVCFQSEADEKRRLAPPPAGWDALPDDELRDLCERGMPMRKREGAAV
jgi:hypothetical protein